MEIDMNEIRDLIQANSYDENRFASLLHQTLLLFVLEEVCNKLKSDPVLKAQVRSDFRKTANHTKVCLKLAKEICGTVLPESDGLLLSNWIKAFFKKSGVRKIPSPSDKQRLLSFQGNKCACCNQPLSLEMSHYDHIIPWDYVGDELPDNYQMLCSYCNEHKSNNVYYLLKRTIVKFNT